MYRNFAELCAEAEEKCLPLHRVVLEDEMALSQWGEKEVYEELAARWQVMKQSALAALEEPRQMPMGLIEGQAGAQREYSARGGCAGSQMNMLMAMALSASEVNASMGRICAAPTAGACGVLPAVLLTVQKAEAAREEQMLDALLLAGGVGAIITKNATVSGAQGGCQAECGAAAAMAAAAAVAMKGGEARQVGNAIAICLMNCMGLVCDPVAGLVQLPCSFRNASQAVNALISADLALAGQNPLVSADEAIEAMYRTGKRLPMELRETALGGIAATPTAKAVKKQFRKNLGN